MNDKILELDNMVWFHCTQDYERIMCLLNDTIFLANEKDLHSITTLLRAVRDKVECIGKMTGMNGQERIEFKLG